MLKEMYHWQKIFEGHFMSVDFLSIIVFASWLPYGDQPIVPHVSRTMYFASSPAHRIGAMNLNFENHEPK
jgi:hypothetical protein